MYGRSSYRLGMRGVGGYGGEAFGDAVEVFTAGSDGFTVMKEVIVTPGSQFPIRTHPLVDGTMCLKCV